MLDRKYRNFRKSAGWPQRRRAAEQASGGSAEGPIQYRWMNEMSAGWHSEPNATFSDKSTPYRLCLRGVGKRFQLSMRRVFSTLFVVLLLVAAFLLYLQRGALSSTAESFIPADFNAITSALKTYKINAGRYPTDEQGLRALLERPVSEPAPKRWVQILRKLPTDSWDNEYHYRALPNDDKRGFELRSAGKDRILGTKDDLSSLKSGGD